MASPVRLSALVVGSGWARHAATAFANREGEIEIVGVVGRGSARTEALARQLATRAYTSLDEALAVRAPQLAVVAVDEASNVKVVQQLVMAGADVLCAHPVARTAAEVRALSELARERGRIISTDYTLRTCAETITALEAVKSSGALLRVDIIYPGRLLPMALDLALVFGGRAMAVCGFGTYPEETAEQRARAPAAFPPTVVIEHMSGCVTTLCPCPHAETSRAFSVTASCAGARIELALPSGGARKVRLLKTGRTEVVVLRRAPRQEQEAVAVFGAAMRKLADDFVDAVLTRGVAPCSLESEGAVRSAWAAIAHSMRSFGRVETVRTSAGW